METKLKSLELPTRVTLPYIELGDPMGIPVLLLHGVGDSWRSFEPLLPHLPGTIHVFALSQRGHGDASRPAAGYRLADFAKDLAAFLDAVNLDAVVLAGHSMGSAIAMRFALDHPARTHGLVLASPRSDMRNRPGIQELWDTTISKLADPISPDFFRRLTVLYQPVPPSFLESMLQENLKVPAHVWKAVFLAGMEEDFSSEFMRIQTRSILLWGGRDASIPENERETLSASIAGAQLQIYPNAGHMLHWEEPERFASDLAVFVFSLRPA